MLVSLAYITNLLSVSFMHCTNIICIIRIRMRRKREIKPSRPLDFHTANIEGTKGLPAFTSHAHKMMMLPLLGDPTKVQCCQMTWHKDKTVAGQTPIQL